MVSGILSATSTTWMQDEPWGAGNIIQAEQAAHEDRAVSRGPGAERA